MVEVDTTDDTTDKDDAGAGGPGDFWGGILPTMLNNCAAVAAAHPQDMARNKGEIRASITFFSVGPSLASYWTRTALTWTFTSARSPRTAKDRTPDSSMSERYKQHPHQTRPAQYAPGAYRVRGTETRRARQRLC